MKLNKHFNQTSNKILSVDELAKRHAEADNSPDDFENDKDILSDLAEWQDAAGHLYVSEMSIKNIFSTLAGGDTHEDTSERRAALAQNHFPKLQKIMDDSEDHTARLTAGRLFQKDGKLPNIKR